MRLLATCQVFCSCLENSKSWFFLGLFFQKSKGRVKKKTPQNQQIHKANKRQKFEKPLDGFLGLIQSFRILGSFPVLHSMSQTCLLSYEKFISLSSCSYFVSDQHVVATLGKQLSVNHVTLSYTCILPCSCLILYCANICLQLKIITKETQVTIVSDSFTYSEKFYFFCD